MSDSRFASAKTDPRFRRPKNKQTKVEIDDRFKEVLESSDFAEGSGGKSKGRRLDKYGRPLTASHEADQLKRFYRLRSVSPQADADHKPAFVDYARGEGALESSASEDGSSDEESEVEQEELSIGPSRPKGVMPAVSDSEDDADELQVNLDEDEEPSAFPSEGDIVDMEEETVDPTPRIAAVNMDWDNLKAGDLFSIFNSFLQPSPKDPQPAPGKLLHVKVYPSEFGKERMAREEIEGPGGGTFTAPVGGKVQVKDATSETSGVQRLSDVEDEDGASGREDGDVDMDQLRQYQLERLRYFYAVATFSNAVAAARVLSECNGTEFEHTANVMDLSYVPDEMDFDEDEPRDEATEEPKAYKGTDFVTDALRHSKVKLTWDQDDPSRNKLTRRTLTRQEIEEEDFKTYLASESDGSGSDAEVPQSLKQPGESAKARTARLRALLLGNGEDGAEGVWGKQGRTAATALEASNSRSSEGMEITFKPGLTAAVAAADDEELTTLQKYQRRMKEKLQRKKEKRELRNSGTKATGDGADKPDVIADDFFGADEAEEPPREKKKASKPVIANTETLSDAIDGDPSRHFSMTDVVKEERQAGKKRRRGKHGKKTDVGHERERELGDDQWQIDVKDERFRALHEEAEFAIDPSNPKYQKTKAMEKLLAERSARRNQTADQLAELPSKRKADKLDTEKDLSALVKSAKRRQGRR